MAVWFRRTWGWVRKGADIVGGYLGYGSGSYGEDPYGDPE